jgi:predicted methyltransferase
MRRTPGWICLIALLILAAPSLAADGDNAKLHAAVAGSQRTEANRARDVYRHPEEELRFLGLKDDMTVIEIMPGAGGWWTEILAPYLRDQGRYYVALPDTTHSAGEQRANAAFTAKIGADPAIYDKVTLTHFDGDRLDVAPPGSADLIMTFRNLHDWMAQGVAEGSLKAFYRALKPGGIFGIEDHRAFADKPQDPKAGTGYIRQDYAIALIEAAGFKFVASSELLANPKDTKDYPAGVWTLPPTFRLKDQDRDKYIAIGEADNFLLKFAKP